MRIQIIDKNTAKCFLELEDLYDFDISIDDLKNGIRGNCVDREIIHKFMGVVDAINMELINNGEEPFIKESAMVSLKIVVMANNTLELTVNTRSVGVNPMIQEDIPLEELEEMVENEEEFPPMPKFLENIFRGMLGLPVDWDGYDENYEISKTEPNLPTTPLFPPTNNINNENNVSQPTRVNRHREINTRKTLEETLLKDNGALFYFPRLDDVISFVKVLPEIETSMLFKHNNKYYLSISNASENDMKIIEYAYREFYLFSGREKPPTRAYINEHGVAIIKDGAIQKLRNL